MTEDRQTTNQSPDSAEGQLVVFALADEEFGVDINKVREIVRVPDITPIPQSPDYVAGICNLRGSVLPALDSRHRFGMERVEAGDNTRLLVVETGASITGLIVDDVREVLHTEPGQMEDSPAVCKGVDREFLAGVVKMDKGRRLILILDLDEVGRVEVAADKGGKAAVSQSRKTEAAGVVERIDEEQLVSFMVADEEYAFDINQVREILRVDEITEVPNADDYVRGLLTIRNQLLPVLDLRTMLGNTTLVAQFHAEIDKVVSDHEKWFLDFKNALEAGTPFNGELDPGRSAFGQWLARERSGDISELVKGIKTPYANFFKLGAEALKLAGGNQEEALAFFAEHLVPLEKSIKSGFKTLKNTFAENINEFQRILVVETGEIHVGLIVDSVNEVVRIPKDIIDETPWVATSAKKELKGVAKLDEGRRLIMIMDESSLLSQEEGAELGKLSKTAKTRTGTDNGEQKKVRMVRKEVDDEQLVTFTIAQEEYGIKIMQVQEINRLEEITSVPKAPSFIDGVTNLRGNVIPVLNMRILFGLESRDQDDATRIIIVDLDGRRIGLRVDKVNEVLRLPRSDIDPTPGIVAGHADHRFLEGVCQLDKGKRMVLLLDISEILSTKDKKAIETIDGRKPAGKAVTGKAKTKAKPKSSSAAKTRKKKKKMVVAE